MSTFVTLATSIPGPLDPGTWVPRTYEVGDAVMWRKRSWNRQDWHQIPARVIRMTAKMAEIELLHSVRGLYRTMATKTNLRPAGPTDLRLVGNLIVTPDGAGLRARVSGCFLIHRQMDVIRGEQTIQRGREYWELHASLTREERIACAVLLKHMYDMAAKAMQDRTGSYADYIAARTEWRKFRGWV